MSSQPSPDHSAEGDAPGERAGQANSLTGERPRPPRLLPPRLIRSIGTAHHAFYRLTGGRLGLSRPKPDRWGTMCLTTIGRHTGKERSAMLGYFEDGPNLVALAVNAWADAEPAWWLNLQAHPDARVELPDGPRPVRARAAEGDERARLGPVA